MIPHAIKAPLASAFVLPGMGQLVNRQPAKAVALILGAGLFFAAGVFFVLREFSRALREPLVSQAADDQKWTALLDQMNRQGAEWLWILAAVWLAIWCYGVVDAVIWGRRIDLHLRGS